LVLLLTPELLFTGIILPCKKDLLFNIEGMTEIRLFILFTTSSLLVLDRLTLLRIKIGTMIFPFFSLGAMR
jgi:hypothetical protein